MTNKSGTNKVIIAGAGIAGLTAGIYAQQSGFDTTILEMHSIPGGNSTSWRRGGFLFEGGMHWLTGSNSNIPLNRIWRDVGALDDSIPVSYRDPYFTYDDKGIKVHLYRNADKLKEHLISVSPEDTREIVSLCREVKSFSKLKMPITDIKGVRVKEKSSISLKLLIDMLPVLPGISKFNKLSIGEYCERFRHPAIRSMLSGMIGEEYSASTLFFTLACFASGDGGYPKGGSLSMALRMAKRYEELGGRIIYGTRVERVDVENSRAVGVVANGEKIPTDAVIVTADTLCAIDSLFGEQLHEPWMEKLRRNTKFTACTFISLGVGEDLSDLPESLVFGLEEPIEYAGGKVDSLGFHNYAKYEGYAPEGCSSLTTALLGDTYDYWKELRSRGEYDKEKQRIADAIIDRISHKVPRIRDKIRIVDVATPLTYERYCGTYHGSWMTMTGKGDKTTQYPLKPKSIDRLYFAGQRLVTPGGLPVAAYTGRNAVQYLCRDFGEVFQVCK